MSDTLLGLTRNGLFRRPAGPIQWARSRHGRSISSATMSSIALAALATATVTRRSDHGHFRVKLHRSSKDVGRQIATPAYPPKPEGD